MRLDRATLEQTKAVLNAAIDEVDADIVDALRRNEGKQGSRESLLAELDVLEKVRERLHVRYERATSHIDGSSSV